jgi:hypothetical protein
MAWLRRLGLVLVITSPLAFGGCKQGVGDRCQTNDDCDSNLTCILPPGGSALTGGTCEPANADLGVDMTNSSMDLSTQMSD